MTTVVKESVSGGDFKLVPAGAHVAICDRVIDLGIQPSKQYQPRRKIYLRWQIPGEIVKWTKDGKEQSGPAVIGTTLTLSLHEKGKLRPLLESWRGKPFTPAELKGFDVAAVIGTPCMIQVGHEAGNNGRTYANVLSVMSMPKGMAKPSLSGEPLVFDVDNPDQQVFDQLPPWLREKIIGRLTEDDVIEHMAANPEDDVGF